MLLRNHAFRGMAWVVTPVLLFFLSSFSAHANSVPLVSAGTQTKSVTATLHAPSFGRHEFMQFEDFNGKTLLKELHLAPKVAVRLKEPEQRNDIKWIQSFAKRHNGVVDTKLFRVPSGIHLVVEYRNSPDQNEMLANLNRLLADPNVEDVSPVFYVNNREALVSGVTLVFATPIPRLQLEQMFYGYGDIKDVSLAPVDKFGTWNVTLRNRLFTMPADVIVKEGGKSPRRRFDMHLLLLANLLESQQLFKGVPIKSARPTFAFLEEPISASAFVDWGSESIGAVRRVVLSVVIPNESQVIFDPKRVPEFGTGGFLPYGEDEPIRTGWFLFADENNIPQKKNPGWKMTKKAVRSGSRTITVYEFVQHFYVFQPSTVWRIPDVAIRYQTIGKNGEKSESLVVISPATKFYVFSHEKLEGDIAMPLPASYAPPAEVLAMIAPPTRILPEANTHQYASIVAKWGERTIAIAWILALCIGLFSVCIGVGILVKNKRKALALRPKQLPLLSEQDFSTAHARVRAIQDDRAALAELQKLATKIVGARLPKLTAGNVTTNRLKEALRNTQDEHPEFKGAYLTAIELFEYLGALDAPTEMFAGNSEKAHELIVELYRKLSSLPPKMVATEVSDDPGSVVSV